jgi:TET-Associated Glycosyltransferase
MKIFIPTYGRHDKQITSTLLSKAEIPHTLVTEENPKIYNLTQYANIIRCPSLHIGSMRQWIQDNTLTSKLIMMDDDLTFRVRINNSFVRSNPAQIQDMIHLINKLLDKYAHVGFVDEYMCNTRPHGYVIGGRYTNLLAYNRKLFPNPHPTYRIELNEEHDFNLQLTTQGLPPAILCDYTRSTQPYAPGGCSRYRTSTTELDSHKALTKLWPELVRILPSKTGKSGYRVAISWKKALTVSAGLV